MSASASAGACGRKSMGAGMGAGARAQARKRAHERERWLGHRQGHGLGWCAMAPAPATGQGRVMARAWQRGRAHEQAGRGEDGQKKGGPEAGQCPNDGICLGGHVRRPLIPAGLEGQAHWIGAGRLARAGDLLGAAAREAGERRATAKVAAVMDRAARAGRAMDGQPRCSNFGIGLRGKLLSGGQEAWRARQITESGGDKQEHEQ